MNDQLPCSNGIWQWVGYFRHQVGMLSSKAMCRKHKKKMSLTVCGIWAGYPCWPMFTAKGTYNGHMSIRAALQSNERWWPGLINHIFFYFYVDGWVHVRYLPGNRWHLDGKNAGQQSSVMLWAILLGSLGCCLKCGWYVTHTTYLNIVADQVHPFMETIS